MISGSVIDERSVYEIAYQRFYMSLRERGKLGVPMTKDKLVEMLCSAAGITGASEEQFFGEWCKREILIRMPGNRYVMPFNKAEEGIKPQPFNPNFG